MSFIHFSILAVGGFSVAIPVVLHLVMRRRPRHQVFPALRFVKARQQSNKRTMQLRHWLLLALRCAALGAFAAALARPTVAAAAYGDWGILAGLALVAAGSVALALLAWRQQRGPLLVGSLGVLSAGLLIATTTLFLQYLRRDAGSWVGDQAAPLSAVLVFDTSPRMQYREGNETRLELAQEQALWLLKQFPEDSEIAVMDTGSGPVNFALDRMLAQQTVESLQVNSMSRNLPETIGRARELLKEARYTQRELYVFSDLTAASWQTRLPAEQTQLDPQEHLLVYVLDVGTDDVRNSGLADVELSQESLARNASIRIRTYLRAAGAAATWNVELQLETQDPRLPMIVDGQPQLPSRKLHGQQQLEVEPGQPQPLEFSLENLDPGTHHGQVRLRGEDGLLVDNVRYFTLSVMEAWPVLVVAPAGAETRYLVDQLAPYRWRQTGQSRFRPDVAHVDQLDAVDLSAYAAVALLDPPPLTVRQWRALADYVQAGGGLAVFLGRNVGDVGKFHSAATDDVLPGTVRRQWRAGNDNITLSLREANHPMLQEFQPIKDSVPWQQLPIFRHWSFEKLAAESVVVMRYNNDQPAIVERVVGAGRVIEMTTPVSDPLNVAGRPAWNVLPTAPGPNGWPFFVLVNEMFTYLVRQDASRLNYQIGEPATLLIPDADRGDRFQMFSPSGTWQDVTPRDGVLSVPFTDHVGTYRFRSNTVRDRTWGFSVNLPAAATQLDRITTDRLDELFGADQYHLARDRTDINREMVEARMGRELYPWLILLTAVLLIAEFLLSNRFYPETNRSPSAP